MTELPPDAIRCQYGQPIGYPDAYGRCQLEADFIIIFTPTECAHGMDRGTRQHYCREHAQWKLAEIGKNAKQYCAQKCSVHWGLWDHFVSVEPL